MNTAADTYISNALEDYLKAIYLLSRKKPAVRITAIALQLGLSKTTAKRTVNTIKA